MIETIKSTTASLELEGRILRVTIFSGVDIGAEEMKEQLEMAKEMVGSEPYVALIDSRNPHFSDKAAREYLAKNLLPNCHAMAIVANNLAVNLLANFFIKFNQPKVPTKLFKKISVAEKWLKEKI